MIDDEVNKPRQNLSNYLKFLQNLFDNRTSNMGFDCSSLSFTLATSFECVLLAAIYCSIFLEASVLPDPDSPEINTH